jgi:HSP20 family protein
MFQTLYRSDLFAELDRVQREVQRLFGPTPGIRGMGRSGFPAINIGNAPDAVDIYAFAPGLDPAKVSVNVEKGLLTISGERRDKLPAENEEATVHVDERFAGDFTRVVSLSDDLDPNQVSAKYSDGVLHIRVKRRESSQPRRIEIRG